MEIYFGLGTLFGVLLTLFFLSVSIKRMSETIREGNFRYEELMKKMLELETDKQILFLAFQRKSDENERLCREKLNGGWD